MVLGADPAGAVRQLGGPADHPAHRRRLPGERRNWSARRRAKHRQAVASVISWVTIALICVMVIVEITDILEIPVGSLVAPAAVHRRRARFRRAAAWSRTCCRGSSSSPRSSTASAIWFELTIRLGRRRDGHGRRRHPAGHQTADRRGRDVHHPQRRDHQVDQPVQGLGARRRRHSGADVRRPQRGQRGAARRRRGRGGGHYLEICCWTRPR